MRQRRMTSRVLKTVAAGTLLLVCHTLREPGAVPSRTSRGGPSVVVALPGSAPRTPASSPGRKTPSREQPRGTTPRQPGFSLEWDRVAGSLPSSLDYVRQEVGGRVGPLDFPSQGLRTSWLPSMGPRGGVLDLSLFFHWDDWKVAVDVHNQASAAGYFPGLNVELYEYPLFVSRRPLLISPRLGFWTEPVSWGVVGSLALEIPLDDNLWLWLEGGVRSARDYPGVRTGLHWSL